MRGGKLGLSDFDGPERRSRTRFPIELGAHYTVDGGNDISATGQTVNISSNGVLITSAHEVSPDTSIRVVIEWPILIGNGRPLALHTHGTVVRSDNGLVAVRLSTHEFRTQPKPPDQVQNIPKWRVRRRVGQ